jgi:hypothetical protein
MLSIKAGGCVPAEESFLHVKMILLVVPAIVFGSVYVVVAQVV